MAKFFVEMIFLAGSIGFAIRATLILHTGIYTTKWSGEEKSREYKMYAVANYGASVGCFALLLYGFFSK